MSSSGATQRKPATSSKPPSSSPSTSVSSLPKSNTGHVGPSKVPIKTQYLVLYNILSLLLWYAIAIRCLVVFAITGENALLVVKGPPKANATPRKRPSFSKNRPPPKQSSPENLFDATADTLIWTQTLAILEIIHALIGIVGASVVTTTMQVASRLLLVWGILVPFGDALLKENTVQKFASFTGIFALLERFGLGGTLADLEPVQRNQYAYAGMLLAWVVTECIRYMFFIFFLGGFNDIQKVPRPLRWFRYNSFFVLYPVGISCECWLVYHAIPHASQIDQRLGWALYAVLAIYVPGSYILYTHMIKQRARIMKSTTRKARTE